MPGNLVGMRVVIRANDFVPHDINASIVTVDMYRNKLLLELDKPQTLKNILYQYVVASPRLEKDDIGILLQGGCLGSSVIWVPENKYNSKNPLDMSWWRGGAAAIADLCGE